MRNLPFKNIVRKSLNDLHALKNDLPEILARLESDKRGGFPDRNGEQLGRPSGKSDPTANLALGAHDEIESLEKKLYEHLKEAFKHIRIARAASLGLKGLPQVEGQRLNKSLTTKVGECENCQVLVTGSPGDRLRSGRCNACYQYFFRNAKDRIVRQHI